jgi:hypothetical protein
MPWCTAAATPFLSLILNNVDFTFAPILRGSSTAGSLWVSLHTGALSAGSDQTTNEVPATGGYARLEVARNSGSPLWTVTGNVANPAAILAWSELTAGASSATHAAIGTAATGAGVVIVSGALNNPIPIQAGVTPRLGTGTAFTLPTS